MDILGLIALAKSQNGSAGKVFHFKGVKSTTNLLPIQGGEGDVYKVEENNTYFAWNGEGWVNIGQLLSMDDVAALFDQVEDAGDAQVARIVAKGQEVEESIPEDYSDLSDEVDGLKSALKSGDEEDAIYHLGFYLDENGDLCQVEEETNNGQ